MKIKVIEANKPNINGRIYTEECLRKCIIENELVNDQLKNRCLFIEAAGANDNCSDIDLSKVAGAVEAIYLEDGVLYADVVTLNTSYGSRIGEITEVYLNGQGDLEYQGNSNYIVNNYEFFKFTGKIEPKIECFILFDVGDDYKRPPKGWKNLYSFTGSNDDTYYVHFKKIETGEELNYSRRLAADLSKRVSVLSKNEIANEVESARESWTDAGFTFKTYNEKYWRTKCIKQN